MERYSDVATKEKPKAKKHAIPPAKQGGKTQEELKHELVDVGFVDTGGDADSVTIEEAIGGLDWLFDPLATGGGGPDDWTDDPLAEQGYSGESLDLPQKLDHAALSYGAAEDGGRHQRLRRVKPLTAGLPDSVARARRKLDADKSVLTAEEHFGGDDEAIFLAAVLREIVLSALLDNDAWCYEWIFGATYLESEGRPPRNKVLEFFEAREVVFQTRVQYQMLRDGHQCTMHFPCKALDRTFLWQLTSLLAAHKELFAMEHALTVMEQMWTHPGVQEAKLWSLYQKGILARPGQTLHEPSRSSFEASLVYLEMAYLCSRNSKTNGWYLTGKNPARMIDDLRKDLKNFNVATMSRGWSTWF